MGASLSTERRISIASCDDISACIKAEIICAAVSYAHNPFNPLLMNIDRQICIISTTQYRQLGPVHNWDVRERTVNGSANDYFKVVL